MFFAFFKFLQRISLAEINQHVIKCSEAQYFSGQDYSTKYSTPNLHSKGTPTTTDDSSETITEFDDQEYEDASKLESCNKVEIAKPQIIFTKQAISSGSNDHLTEHSKIDCSLENDPVKRLTKRKRNPQNIVCPTCNRSFSKSVSDYFDLKNMRS